MTSLIKLFVFCFLVSSISIAGASNITIIEPTNDNPVISSNFDVIVFINDTQAKSAQVRLVGQSWVPLEQLTSTTWSTRINISNLPDGIGQLSAKYLRAGEVVWNYVVESTSITIKNPAPVIVTGSIQVTVKDFLGNPLQDVIANPTGNKTDSNGLVIIGNQPLNTEITFSFSKTGYNTSYLVRTFTNNNPLSHTLTLNSQSGNNRKFRVSGYNDYAEAGSMFNLKITDDATGEPVGGAEVIIYNQNEIVMSIPGTTSLKGRITASFVHAGSFWIGVEKSGFADWESDEILILAPRNTPTPTPTPSPTPSPTPTPTPVPTPDPSKYRPDANMKLTDDEYRQWMDSQEKQNAAQNMSLQPSAYSPPPEPGKPWGLYGLVGLVVGAAGLKYTQDRQKKRAANEDYAQGKPDEYPALPDTQNKELNPDVIEQKEILQCEFCEWNTEIGKNMSESMKKALLEMHYRGEKHGTPPKIEKGVE